MCSSDLREALRHGAFEEIAQRRELLALQRLEEAARREAAKAEREASVAQRTKSRRPQREDELAEDPTGPLERFGADTIERLKSIISQFDRLGDEPPSAVTSQ